MSVASKTLINKLAKNFVGRGGTIINNPESWNYLDKREAEAIIRLLLDKKLEEKLKRINHNENS